MLLTLTFLIEAAVLSWVAWRGLSFKRPDSSHRLPLPQPSDSAPPGSKPGVAIALLSITALAVVLRSIRLDSDLWLDEVTSVVYFARLSYAKLIGGYLSPNSHLLNTLLMKTAIGVFGEHEWAVRLPAAALGAATVPLLYWVGRLAMSRAASLGAALLLAVSYHHIFFSQNARGYTAYLFFALLSSGLLLLRRVEAALSRGTEVPGKDARAGRSRHRGFHCRPSNAILRERVRDSTTAYLYSSQRSNFDSLVATRRSANSTP